MNASNEEVSLREIFSTLYKWKKQLTISFIALISLTFSLQQISYSRENIYKASAQVRIQETSVTPVILPIQGMDVRIRFDPEQEAKKVISDENLKTALSILGWELSPQNISKLRGSIQTSSSRNIINIDAYSHSPVEARDVANAVAQAYVNNSTRWFSKAVDSALEFLKNSSDNLVEKLRHSYSELGKLSEKTGIINPESQFFYEIDRIRKASEKINEIDSKISTIEKIFLAISKSPEQTKKIISDPEKIFMKDGIPESKEALEAIREHIGALLAIDESIGDAYRKYTELETKRVELLSKYSEGHPVIIAIDRQIVQIFDDVLAKARLLMAKLKIERKNAELEIQKTKEKIREISSSMSDYYYLANNIDILSRTFENYSDKFLELKIGSAIFQGSAEVYRSAIVPQKPVRKTFRNLIISLIVAGAGAIIIAFILENLDVRIKSPEEIILTLKQFKDLQSRAILWVVPKGIGIKQGLADVRHLDRIVYEQIRAIRINLALSAQSQSLKILICSSIPQEGKTFLAYNLAISFAEAGAKTALLDLNLRHNALSKELSLPEEKSFIHYLEKTKSLDEIKHKIEDNLYLYGIAGDTAISPDILSSKAFSDFIQALSNEYKVIISDSAPLIIPDILPAVKLFDIVIVVYNITETGAKTLKRTISYLRQAEGRDIRIVINKVIPEFRDFYYYQYFGPRYYRKYYSKYYSKYYNRSSRNQNQDKSQKV